ncbi:Uncharacterized protein BC141101_01974 [Bacillus toyonensis]|uniref:hypothetical protein n=1 Tax=Bacillus TaxID=1386 RepID=UPI0002793A3D|nr:MULTISPECIES: hypothetical protein [Bacillus]EOP24422.1 hypothetical protein IIS_01813 [Bacillus cereus VD131]MCS3596713.1 hypothetical protein [Bacillus sp. JUb91]MDH8705043.1 hypothetical protein [Stenotrophomonas sp. 1198]MDP9745977.1 hypothetical protein [Bacillus thuringiensis]EJQ80464.1 hypothetical protein IGK_01809 [Bacillus toyonensis]
MVDIIRLLIIILIAIFLFSSIIMEFKKPQKSMFWFSIEVLFLLGIVLLMKEFFFKLSA